MRCSDEYWNQIKLAKSRTAYSRHLIRMYYKLYRNLTILSGVIYYHHFGRLSDGHVLPKTLCNDECARRAPQAVPTSDEEPLLGLHSAGTAAQQQNKPTMTALNLFILTPFNY